ncbi:MAG: pantetheine-phosphate adenylyltransferase [Spirochaetaceae bacterium]|jgi:pantetheine-phosphate adenylyltransferase|nr:pantetheine-phosphate adenylyltransferase [Spirochaetaceae bacterium]HPX27403.1 pantetheine-phosphate adenylyltransferase [Treponemataceae bacterium]
MITALFPGSFDPPTFGHLNIIERARKIFGEIHVVIAVNSQKKYLFSEDERLEMMQKLTDKWDNVHVSTCRTLIVEYARKNNAIVLLRGIRNVSDFSYEFDLSMLNKGLDSSIETVFMPTDPEFFVLKSSAIKELALLGGDISKMVPDLVANLLKKKLIK